MTWVSFPDLESSSSNGLFRGEAKSPDNGSIPGPDGKMPGPTSFGSQYGHEQGNFRFRLLDAQDRVVWERWQPAREPSPVELYVADEGWLVIRTHGDRLTYLVCISPAGAETIRVIVTDPCIHRPPCAIPPPGSPIVTATNASLSTAGLSWSWASIPFFFSHENDAYFSMWPSWAERFVINLTQGRLLIQPSPDVCRKCQSLESRFAEDYLQSPDPDRDISTCLGVVAMIGSQRMKQLVPVVQNCWRTIKGKPWLTTRSNVVRDEYRTTLEPLPTMALVLAYFGALEPGPACYSFHPGWATDKLQLLSVPRERYVRLATLDLGMNATVVLELLGCPDYIESFREQTKTQYLWGEQWDYYTQEPMGVVRIRWEPDCYGQKMLSLQRLTLSPDDLDARLSVLLSS